MDRLTTASFSLLDYDGDITGFNRQGQGKQDWPGFCSIDGKWTNNKLNGSSRVIFKNFPLTIYGDFKNNIMFNASINFGDGEFKLDVKLNKDMFIESGIMGFSKDFEFHFKLSNSKVENIVLIRNGETLDHSAYLIEGVLQYPLNPQNSLFFGFDVQRMVVELYNLDEYKARCDSCYLINLRLNCYVISNYEDGEIAGLQQVLDFGKAIPSIKKYWLRVDEEEEDSIHYADGSVLTNKSGETTAKMIYKGVDSYITGHKRDDRLRGPVDIVIDGKYSLSAEMKDEGLVFKDPRKLFKTIDNVKDQTLDEYNEDLLNGYAKYDYANGTVYEGFFLNDFVYCHKDSLLSCLHNMNKPRNPDLEAFIAKISRFEGVIQDGKILGKAKARYRNGTLYEGFYDAYFLKTGTAVEFANNGDLYSGEFKNDMFNGFGKLFKPDQPLSIGIFEDNVLKLKFDMENLDQNIIDKLKHDYEKVQTINEQKIQEVVEQKTFKPGNEEERLKNDRDEKLQKLVEDEKQRKLEEAEKLIQELQREMVVKKIFSFKNGYAYHGKIKGNNILDNEMGDIIDPEGNRIPVMYKYIKDLNIGSFRSLNKKLVFIYKIETKELARVELNREAQEIEHPQNDQTVLKSLIRSQISQQDEPSSSHTIFEDDSSKDRAKDIISDTDGISNLIVHEDTEKANLESNVYLEDENLIDTDKEGQIYHREEIEGKNVIVQSQTDKNNPFLKNKFFTIMEDPIENESGIDQSALREDYYKRVIEEAKIGQDEEIEFKSQTL